MSRSAQAAVSVIIPVYNGEAYLRPCLDSVFAQTLKNIQVICVNDGSTDASAEILTSYQHAHPNMLVITQENGGLSAARNAGIAKATGEYLDFLDCDDALREDALERLYAKASRHQLDMLFYDGETVYATEDLRKAFPRYETLYRTTITMTKPFLSGEALFTQLVTHGSYRASACMYLLRAEFLRAEGFSFIPGIYYEDNVFTLQCLLSAQRASIEKVPFYLRALRDDSIVTAFKDYRHVRSYYISQNAIQHFVLTRRFSPEAVQCAQQQVSSLMVNALRIVDAMSEAERSAILKQYPDAAMIIRALQDSTLSAPPLSADEASARTETAAMAPWQTSAQLRPYLTQAYRPEAPLVSVIMPVYNAEPYLRDTLRSLRQQTLQNYEVILVDDGSTDQSCDIIQEYATSDPRISLLRQQNQHAGVARNAGMDRAKGEYLLFLDADDEFSPDLLTYTAACAQHHQADVVLFHADLLQMPSATLTPASFLCPCRHLPTHVFSGEEGRDHIFDVLNPWTKLYRRTYIQQLGVRFQSLYSSNDLYFSMIALACANRIAPLPQVLVHYRVGLEQNIQSRKTKAPLDTYIAFSAVKEELLKRQLYDTFRKPFAVKAAESMLRTLDTMKSMESYRQLYQTLHGGGLAALDIDCVAAADMRHISDGAYKLQRCHDIMDKDLDAYCLQALTTQEPAQAAAGRTMAAGREVQRLQAEVAALRGSHAFRIGSILVRPLHWVKTCIRRFRRP